MNSKHTWRKRSNSGKNRLAIGMVIALSASLMAFEWTSFDHRSRSVIDYDPNEDFIEDVYPPVVPIPKGKKTVTVKKKLINLNNVIAADDTTEPVEDPDVTKEVDKASTDDGDDTPLTAPSDLLGDETDDIPPSPLLRVEIMPYFKKCFSNEEFDRQECTRERIHKHLERHLKVPRNVREDVRTTVTFVIEKDGKVGRIHCAPRVAKSVQQEIERVLNILPQMQPGVQQGHKVPVYYQIPISVKMVG